MLTIGVRISLRHPPTPHGDRVLPLSVRIYLTFSLLLVSFYILWINQNEMLTHYKLFVCLGMLASLFGDLFLAKVFKTKNYFYKGIISFGIGHILYSCAYQFTLNNFNVDFIKYISIVILIMIFDWSVYIFILVKNKYKNRTMIMYTFIYCTIISFMMCSAVVLALSVGKSFWITALGAVIFVVSDQLILFTNVLQKRIRNASLLIWITYVIAQICIIYSSLI